MTYRLKNEDKLVGLKQVQRAIRNQEVKLVYLAEDTDKHIKQSVINLCMKNNIDIQYVNNMKELGEACQIDINAAVAALLK